jgi:hypothetical protein
MLDVTLKRAGLFHEDAMFVKADIAIIQHTHCEYRRVLAVGTVGSLVVGTVDSLIVSTMSFQL